MKTTTKLSIANLKANKSRSILIIISVMLTTMLLTIIALSGYGLMQNQKVNAGWMYGEHYGGYIRVSQEIYDKMKIHAEFYNVGRMQTFGTADLEDADGMLAFWDAVTRQLSHFKLDEGTYPEKENEIAAQRGFFRHAGYEDAKIGDTVTLSYRIGSGAYVTENFVVSGFLPEQEANELRGLYGAYVSEAFYEQAVPREDRSYSVCFQVRNEEELNEDGMEAKIKSLAADLGVEESRVSVNYGYLMWLLDPGTETILICLAIAALVVLFAALVIYNIFYVGIIQKVQEYGKLRAIGTTKKQIKNILQKEGSILAGAGIAAGLLFGYAVSNAFFQWLLQRMYQDLSMTNIETVSVGNLPLMFLAAGISFVTVYISLQKPMRIAAGISPVEAMRYQEETGKGKGRRKGYRNMNVLRLTFSNLSRNKKRTLTTIFTMGLSCVMFVTIANVAGNMDIEYDARKSVEKGDFSITLDASMHDEAYPENDINHVQQQNLMSEEWLNEIRNIDGVTKVETRSGILIKRAIKTEDAEEPYCFATVYSKEDYEKLETKRGTLNYDSAAANDEIIFGYDYWMEDYGYAIGDTVELTFFDGDREIPMTFTLAGSTEVYSTFVLTEEQLQNLNLTENMTYMVWVSCEKSKLVSVEEALKRLTAGSEYYEITAYQDAYKLSKTAIGLLKGAAYAMLGIIGIIGFMNMANTLITSIITRRRELGILQAIGMTKRQLNCMLQMEGLVFTAGTLLVSMSVGNLFGYLVFLKCKSIGMVGIHVYQLPVPELAVMAAVLILLQMILSVFMSRYLQKDALIVRIRHQE